jgi:hypothetical protein
LCTLPEPHPLDYDWRFSAETTDNICTLFPSRESILAVGAPSIARRIEGKGGLVTLVDRQPLQGVRDHRVIEVGADGISMGPYSAAIVDPPWYSLTLRSWTAWAATFVALDGTLLVSLWPDDARPGGAEEADQVMKWMLDWANVEIVPFVARYERPKFESAALSASMGGFLASSPGEGRLLRLRIKHHPDLPKGFRRKKRWLRFVLDDYQLALRLDDTGEVPIGIRRHPNAIDWIWPYVSKRAPERQMINLWSSHNEVAIVDGPDELADALRRAINAPTARSFDAELRNHAHLLAWDVPRPPYRRLLEWQHLQ